MVVAARAVQAASGVLRAEKEARGLMQPVSIDPNQTGMIGAEYTGITTTLGDLASKRTATNPDMAAVVVNWLSSLGLKRGTPLVIVVSGSFVGGDIATIAAAEALGLKPILIASLSASMWGANDPGFNLLDMMQVLRGSGVIRTSVIAAVLGGEGSVGIGMDPDGVRALRASAARDQVPIIEQRPLLALVDSVLARVDMALSDDSPPGAVMNVGGALIGLGTCRESYELPPGLTKTVTCHDGVPGLAIRLAERGLPMLNVINLRRLAIENGLPFDPVSLPNPGNNLAIYRKTTNVLH